MTLTPSDVASASRWLSFWEIIEYTSEAVVFLGCVGEFVAEYTKWRTEEYRHALGRRSLVFLTLGIGMGLLSLIQTNALSSVVLESLGQKAERVGKTAQLASETADAAIFKSTQATAASGDAISTSNKAEGIASNALVLARGARKEADSFERDIVSAKKQAADAESHLAEALKRAADASTELERIKSPRSLTNISGLIDSLRHFSGTEFIFGSVFGDEESFQLLVQIDNVLERAGWKRIKHSNMNIGIPARQIAGRDDIVNIGFGTGVEIEVESTETLQALQSLSRERLPSYVRTAIALNEAILPHVSPSEHATAVNVVSGSSHVIRVKVGKKS